MLVLTVKSGDVIEVQTPSGPVRFSLNSGRMKMSPDGSCTRKIGVEAPREWKVVHLKDGLPRQLRARDTR